MAIGHPTAASKTEGRASRHGWFSGGSPASRPGFLLPLFAAFSM